MTIFNSKFYSFCLITFIYLSFIASPAVSGQLKQISSTITKEQTTVHLQLDKIPRYSIHQIKTLQNKPARCYIDLYSSSPAIEVNSRIDLESDQISRIRTGRHGTMTRVVLDLNPQTDCRIRVNKSRALIYMITNSFSENPLSTDITPYDGNPLKRRLPQNLWVEKNQLSKETIEEDGMTDNLTGDWQPDDIMALFDEASENKPLNIWGWVQGYAATDTNSEPDEDHKLLRTTARIGLKKDYFTSNAHNIEAELSGDIDYINYDNSEASNDVDFRFYDAYLKYNSTNWDLSIGKQRVRWGKSDQVSPLDNVNPDDLRQSVAVPYEQRKLSSWLANLKIYGDKIKVETNLSPVFEKSEIEYLDSDWAIYRNLRQQLLGSSQLPSAIKSNIRDLDIHEDTPDLSPQNISAGVRITWQTEQSDFALSYRYGWETLPFIDSFPIKNINYTPESSKEITTALNNAILTDEDIEISYKRQSTVGFEWESVLDYIGFRGEVAYIDNMSFLKNSLTSTRKPVTHVVTGIDYTSDNEWYYNIQTSWLHIYSYKNEILYYEKDNVSLLGEVRKPLWRGNLEISTKFNYSVTDQSSYLQPSIKIKYFKNMEIESGAKLYSGDPETLMGSYDNADQVYALLKYSF